MTNLTVHDLTEQLADINPALPIRVAQHGGSDLRVNEVLVLPNAIVLVPEPTDEVTEVATHRLDIIEVDAGWQIIFVHTNGGITALGSSINDFMLTEAIVARIYANYPEFLEAMYKGNVDAYVNSLLPSDANLDQ